jgi:Tol biopolymer transport system component
MVDARGSGLPEPRVLYANPEIDWIGPNDWSPDGSWIAVTIVRKDRSLQLGRFDVGTGVLRVLKSFTDWRSLSDAVISPDGLYVAFDEVPAGTVARDIKVLAADGARELTVVTGSSDELPVGWTPEGGLLFLSDRSGSPALWVQPFAAGPAPAAPVALYGDAAHFHPAGVTAAGAVYSVPPPISTSRLRTITANLETGDLLSPVADLPADAGGVNDSVEWSADGKWLAYVARRSSIGGRLSPRLVIRSVDTGRERELRLDAQNIAYPMFSPDGRRLTVIGYRTGQQFVWLVDPSSGEASMVAASTGDRERLIGNAGPPTAPSWSKDGRLIYFRRITPSGWRLFTFEVSTRAEVEIATGRDPQGNVSVSADGTTIYYRHPHESSDEGSRQSMSFVERDLVTGRERELHRRFNLGTPNLSPDGRYLVTGSVDEAASRRTILLISTADGTVHELLSVDLRRGQNLGTGSNNPIVPAGWAPDSRSLLIRRRPLSGPAEVWWAPVDGRRPKLLVTGPDTARARIAADNRTVVFVEPSRDERPEELWALDYLPALRR